MYSLPSEISGNGVKCVAQHTVVPQLCTQPSAEQQSGFRKLVVASKVITIFS